VFDLLYRGATVIDGTGRPGYRADVAIAGDRIAEIGAIDTGAARVIDVAGRVVAPGFIDVHNHDEGWLLKTPHLLPKTSQGFTSEVLMSDGISYAPLTPETARDWIHYLRPLDGLRTADYRGWRSIADYMALLDGRTAQNTIPLVPFANLRVLACGWRRDPADDIQINLMREELRRAMDAGAAGLSTGLDYIAQCFSSTDEIARVAEAMARHEGVYVTHVRYKRGTVWGVREAIEIGRRAGVRVHISHLKAATAQETEEILTLIDSPAARDVDLTFDIYPYMPGSSLLGMLLPYEVWEDGPLAAPTRLADPLVRDRFARAVEGYGLNLNQLTIAWVGSRENQSWQGATLASYVAASGKSLGDALADLLIDENFCVLMVFHVSGDEAVEPFLAHPRMMLGSDGIYFPDGVVHPRVAGSATRMLGRMVRERRLFSLEEAVRKMTSFPAERFGLAQRGVLRNGAIADLVVFDPATVADLATYADPQRLSAGVEHVVVAGRPIIEQGAALPEIEEAPPGRALKFRDAAR